MPGMRRIGARWPPPTNPGLPRDLAKPWRAAAGSIPAEAAPSGEGDRRSSLLGAPGAVCACHQAARRRHGGDAGCGQIAHEQDLWYAVSS